MSSQVSAVPPNKRFQATMRLCMLTVAALCSACVGFEMQYKETEKEEQPNLCLVLPKDGCGISPKVPTPDEQWLKRQWGKPDEVVEVNGKQRWNYKLERTWSGLWLFAIVPITLVLPSGHAWASVELTEGRVSSLYFDNVTYSGFVCPQWTFNTGEGSCRYSIRTPVRR